MRGEGRPIPLASPCPFRACGKQDGATRGLQPMEQSRSSTILIPFQNCAEGIPLLFSSCSTLAIHQGSAAHTSSTSFAEARRFHLPCEMVPNASLHP